MNDFSQLLLFFFIKTKRDTALCAVFDPLDIFTMTDKNKTGDTNCDTRQ